MDSCLARWCVVLLKKEYQDRGAPVMLWIKDAPVIGVDPGSLLDTGENHVSHSRQEHELPW